MTCSVNYSMFERENRTNVASYFFFYFLSLPLPPRTKKKQKWRTRKKGQREGGKKDKETVINQITAKQVQFDRQGRVKFEKEMLLKVIVLIQQIQKITRIAQVLLLVRLLTPSAVAVEFENWQKEHEPCLIKTDFCFLNFSKWRPWNNRYVLLSPDTIIGS